MVQKLKLDIHLNLGDIPTTKKRTELICTPQSMIDYINKYSLTHAVVLYRNIQEYRTVRDAIVPEVVLYPLKWVVDVELDMKQMLENEPEAVGVCVHSHRGTVDGITFGLDYAGRQIHKVFKQLPENFIVCVHTQGVNSYRNISRGLSVVKWAARYPHLKFLIEHTGSYLRKEFYPKIKSWEDFQPGEGKHAPAFLQDAIGSEACINEAMLAAEKMHNIFCDTSIISSKNYKSEIMVKKTQWAFGSDWPFENDLCPIQKQEGTFIKHYGYDDEMIQEVHRRGIHFLQADTKVLFNEHYQLIEAVE